MEYYFINKIKVNTYVVYLHYFVIILFIVAHINVIITRVFMNVGECTSRLFAGTLLRRHLAIIILLYYIISTELNEIIKE